MNNKNNKKKIILGSIIGVLIGTLISVSYAFFTFGKTSLNSQLVAGDIYMQYKETNSINIPDMMPRSTYVDNENGYFEFQITGKNTYTEKDIIYDVVLSYGDTPTDSNRTIRIKDELLRFRLVKVVNNLEQEIFNNRSYTSINNTRIHKETIPAETNSEITTTYRIYAWIGSETKIGNTEDADYSLSDWNKVFASIKVNVTGDFQEKKVLEPLYDIVKTGAVSDATISNLYAKEGVGKFLRNTTASDTYPVYYYRGEVTDNNVIFANKCWKIVRTTDTGGTKLIYNGEGVKSYEGLPVSDYNITTNTGNFEYNSETTSWQTILTSNETYEIDFTVPAGDNYIIDAYAKTGLTSGGAFTIKKGDNQLYNATNACGVKIEYKDTIGTLTSNDVIKLTMQGMGASASAPISISIKVYKIMSAVKSITCDNTGLSSQLPETIAWNPSYKSPAYVGYNYGTTAYEYSTANWTSEAKFGSSYTWNGTSYTLVDATETTPNATHHYSCNATTADASCSDLRYVYNMIGNTKYYITLQNGKGVEDALEEMLSESTDTIKSPIHETINTWYNTNIKTSYGKYVEDTKWCNDRSVSSANLGGWNPNGGSLSVNMNFDVKKRVENASSSDQPVLTCSNTNDIMTFKNGKLDNPVALLTYDEASLAGVQWNSSNSSSYLLTGSYYWLLSPAFFNDEDAFVGEVYNSGLYYFSVNRTGVGVRPSLSLKHGTQVYDGDGTVSNPYIVGTPRT